MKSKIWIQILTLGLMILAACGGGGDSGSSTGTLQLSLTDSTTTKYQAIYVTIRQVEVHKDGGVGWQVISNPNKTYNLLELVNGVREELALVNLASGHYTQMRLILTDTPDDSINILSRRHPHGNYFIDDNDQVFELKVPSGYQTGIKIVKGFNISANQTTELILDFDANRSVVKAGRSGQWLLKPTIKMLDTKECSIIRGNAGMAGVLVSAQVYNSGASLENEVEVKAATVTDSSGNYQLFLDQGTYTLVGYKDGYSPFHKLAKITAAAGNIYTENITLTSASTGNLSGSVYVSGADPEQHVTSSIRQNATVNGNVEQIEVKSLNVENEGTYATILPVGNYTVISSTPGKTTIEQTVTISNLTTTLTISLY